MNLSSPDNGVTPKTEVMWLVMSFMTMTSENKGCNVSQIRYTTPLSYTGKTSNAGFPERLDSCTYLHRCTTQSHVASRIEIWKNHDVFIVLRLWQATVPANQRQL